MPHSPASGQRGRLARASSLRRDAEARTLGSAGRVRWDPPVTRAESALGTGLPRHRHEAGTRCATGGMRAGLTLTWERWGEGLGRGAVPPQGCPPAAAAQELGDAGRAGWPASRAQPPPLRRAAPPSPPPAPPESSEARRSPWDAQGTRCCYR